MTTAKKAPAKATTKAHGKAQKAVAKATTKKAPARKAAEKAPAGKAPAKAAPKKAWPTKAAGVTGSTTPKGSAAVAGAAQETATKGAGTKASLARGKDPRGGLNAEGRRFYKEKEGLNLKPGVKGKADTPEKMVRKGSFLRRHFANPQGPVKDATGKPTRQALEAAAWGEPVPQTEADERKLAAKGSELLEQYHTIKDGAKAGTAKQKAKGSNTVRGTSPAKHGSQKRTGTKAG